MAHARSGRSRRQGLRLTALSSPKFKLRRCGRWLKPVAVRPSAPISPEGPQGTEARVLTGEEAWPVPLAPRDCKIAGKRRALAIPEPSLRCGIDGRARSLATGGASTPGPRQLPSLAGLFARFRTFAT